MNTEEKIAESYLRALETGDVIFEPDGNIPPDFSINNCIGVEVRRLNQHFFDGNNPTGLEQLEISIWNIFIDVLRSFDKYFQGESYWVGIDFQRPLDSSMKKLKTQMKGALASFIKEKPNLPYEIQVNEQVGFYIFHSEPQTDQLFREAGRSDMDAGGFVVSIYIENINHCISDKNRKIGHAFSKYEEWWLLLIDTMAGGLGKDEVFEVKKHVTKLGNFDTLLIIDRDGTLLLKVENK